MKDSKIEDQNKKQHINVIKVYIPLFICALILNVSIGVLVLKQYHPEILDLIYCSFKSKPVDRIPVIYSNRDAIAAHDDALNNYKKTVVDYKAAVKLYQATKKDYEVASAAMNMADQNSKYAVINLTKLIVTIK